jgi:hypothetical protein
MRTVRGASESIPVASKGAHALAATAAWQVTVAATEWPLARRAWPAGHRDWQLRVSDHDPNPDCGGRPAGACGFTWAGRLGGSAGPGPTAPSPPRHGRRAAGAGAGEPHVRLGAARPPKQLPGFGDGPSPTGTGKATATLGWQAPTGCASGDHPAGVPRRKLATVCVCVPVRACPEEPEPLRPSQRESPPDRFLAHSLNSDASGETKRVKRLGRASQCPGIFHDHPTRR